MQSLDYKSLSMKLIDYTDQLINANKKGNKEELNALSLHVAHFVYENKESILNLRGLELESAKDKLNLIVQVLSRDHTISPEAIALSKLIRSIFSGVVVEQPMAKADLTGIDSLPPDAKYLIANYVYSNAIREIIQKQRSVGSCWQELNEKYRDLIDGSVNCRNFISSELKLKFKESKLNQVFIPQYECVIPMTISLVKIILDAGVDPNYLIRKAADHGDLEIVKLLIQSGANVNENDAKKGGFAFRDYTPLMCAKNATVAQFLLDNGADINHVSESMNTALGRASYNGRADVVELLIKRGIDLERRLVFKTHEETVRGNALIGAVTKGSSLEVVRLLVNAGATQEERDCALNTAMDQSMGVPDGVIRELGYHRDIG